MPYHPRAEYAARIAVCAQLAGRGAEIHARLMETSEWREGDSTIVLSGLSEEDRRMIQVCVTSPSADSALLEDASMAKRLGVEATPTTLLQYELQVGSLSDKQKARLLEKVK